MSALDWIGVFASLATSVGVLLAWRQLVLSRQQLVTHFEDSLSTQYRDLLGSLPVKALLGDELSPEELDESLGVFFRYFDLSNEQVFLRQQGRVSRATWSNWAEGITSNLRLPAFRQAWDRTRNKPGKPFDELKALEHHGSGFDPIGKSIRPAFFREEIR